MSERLQLTKWTTALVSLALLLFSASAAPPDSEPLENVQRLAVQGLGTPPQTNEAGNVAAAAGRPLGVTNSTRKPGTRKSVVAILDGLRVEADVRLVFRIQEFDSAPRPDFGVVRVKSVRAPPSSSFAL